MDSSELFCYHNDKDKNNEELFRIKQNGGRNADQFQ